MAHTPQTRGPVGVENGFCLNIHLLWDAPDVSVVGLIKGTVVARSVCARVSNTSCFLFVLYQRGRAASRDNIQYEKHQCFLFFLLFNLKKTHRTSSHRFQISCFNFLCKCEKNSQTLHEKKTWNSYHVLNFLRTLVKRDQTFEHTEAAELLKG